MLRRPQRSLLCLVTLRGVVDDGCRCRRAGRAGCRRWCRARRSASSYPAAVRAAARTSACLKALEELRVPVDELAGTSIGAVIGGFYVSGMSVADLEQLVESLEWERAFLNVTPRRLKSFRRKRDDDSFLVEQKPGLNGGEFELPVGLVQGQVIDMIISRETLRASQVQNFDQLAIPFRAVAGDIVTGEAVVLGSGSLARAIRASMSIPAALSPIEIDGRLLVDGGIAMNLPVDVARDMGADVVIAVDISSDLLSRDTLRSVLDVTAQLTNLLTRGGTLEQRRKLTANDILLLPQFAEDLSSTTFARMGEAIQSGYDAVMQRRADFERLGARRAAIRGATSKRARIRGCAICRSSSSCASITTRPSPTASSSRGSVRSSSASRSTSTRSSAR